MAQTKRKRRSKHRGNAAGMVEARGRTGSGTGGSAKSRGSMTAAELRAERLDRPPSWSAAATRAAITAVLFGLVLAFFMKKELAQVIGLTGFMFLFYIPAGYAMDSFIYKRRMAKKAGGKGKR